MWESGVGGGFHRRLHFALERNGELDLVLKLGSGLCAVQRQHIRRSSRGNITKCFMQVHSSSATHLVHLQRKDVNVGHCAVRLPWLVGFPPYKHERCTQHSQAAPRHTATLCVAMPCLLSFLLLLSPLPLPLANFRGFWRGSRDPATNLPLLHIDH